MLDKLHRITKFLFFSDFANFGDAHFFLQFFELYRILQTVFSSMLLNAGV